MDADAAEAAAGILRTALQQGGPGQRFLLDGTWTSIPDDGVFCRRAEDEALNYSAPFEILVDLAEFYVMSSGFRVS